MDDSGYNTKILQLLKFNGCSWSHRTETLLYTSSLVLSYLLGTKLSQLSTQQNMGFRRRDTH